MRKIKILENQINKTTKLNNEDTVADMRKCNFTCSLKGWEGWGCDVTNQQDNRGNQFPLHFLWFLPTLDRGEKKQTNKK